MDTNTTISQSASDELTILGDFSAVMTETKSAETSHFRCDILLFVATSTEKDELKNVAKSLGLNFVRKQGRAFTYYDLGRVGTYRVMAVRTEMGPFAHNGSSARAILAKTETRATALVSLGMAFGVSPKVQKIGDLVVSRILLPYDNRRVYSENGQSKTDFRKVKAYLAKESLAAVFSNFANSSEWGKKASFGAVLTGGSIIHCAVFREELVRALSHHGELVVGGEMEGIGLLSASDPEDPCWIIVKGISDFADENRSDESEEAKTAFEKARLLACHNAALFVLSALKDFSPDSQYGAH